MPITSLPVYFHLITKHEWSLRHGMKITSHSACIIGQLLDVICFITTKTDLRDMKYTFKLVTYTIDVNSYSTE